ncbi:sulfurtransferase complex subunit TusB [Metallumcola ferriviriculae]|uniref:Sulfurtransferase complex subunit TusB n=1 Tax=Metallumcola ferriviriculae TaxID=3039180 RepID=A0AAU0URU2_9FIRM|nr:sulfurtransferase complex subunit TusB [Desulfitibacteraceae bacterium MK1]
MLTMLDKAPFSRPDYRQALKLAMGQDEGAVILIQDGVYAIKAAPEEYKEITNQVKEKGCKFFALDADLKARGISPDQAKAAGVEVVDFSGFLGLIFKYKKVY